MAWADVYGAEVEVAVRSTSGVGLRLTPAESVDCVVRRCSVRGICIERSVDMLSDVYVGLSGGVRKRVVPLGRQSLRRRLF